MRTALLQRKFLAVFGVTGNISMSCRKSGVHRRTVYGWRENDQAFKELYAETLEDAVDALDEEARRRVVEGVLKPVYQGGKKVGSIREYSDALLILLLKGRRPEVYRDRFEHTGKGGGPVGVTPILVSYHESMRPPEEIEEMNIYQAELEAEAAATRTVLKDIESMSTRLPTEIPGDLEGRGGPAYRSDSSPACSRSADLRHEAVLGPILLVRSPPNGSHLSGKTAGPQTFPSERRRTAARR